MKNSALLVLLLILTLGVGTGCASMEGLGSKGLDLLKKPAEAGIALLADIEVGPIGVNAGPANVSLSVQGGLAKAYAEFQLIDVACMVFGIIPMADLDSCSDASDDDVSDADPES